MSGQFEHMPELLHIEKMIFERDEFDKRMQALADKLNVKIEEIGIAAHDLHISKKDLIRLYAEKENKSRNTGSKKSEDFYGYGEIGEMTEGLIVDAIEEKIGKYIERVRAGLDGLTGVHNRRSFEVELEHRISEIKKEHIGTERRSESENNKEISIIMFDIDFFKKVNDRYGHKAGDCVLVEIATTINEKIRGKGINRDYLARYGGEEFVIIASNSNGDAIQFADRLRREIEAMEIEYENQKIKISISVGVALYNEERVDEIVKIADKALYAAKGEFASLEGEDIEEVREGSHYRNRVCYFDNKTKSFKMYRQKKEDKA